MESVSGINIGDGHALEMKHFTFETATRLFIQSHIHLYFVHTSVYMHFCYLYIKIDVHNFKLDILSGY